MNNISIPHFFNDFIGTVEDFRNLLFNLERGTAYQYGTPEEQFRLLQELHRGFVGIHPNGTENSTNGQDLGSWIYFNKRYYKLTDSETESVQGAQGARGYTGSQGIQGTQGGVGIQGTQGDAGNIFLIQGIQGVQGIQGTAGMVVFGVIGDDGVVGIQGVQGGMGIQGVQGIQGTMGTVGIQGETGIQGSPGTQGIQGIQGVQGTVGIQGIPGMDGEPGIQGTQGVPGAQGIQGSMIGGTIYRTRLILIHSDDESLDNSDVIVSDEYNEYNSYEDAINSINQVVSYYGINHYISDFNSVLVLNLQEDPSAVPNFYSYLIESIPAHMGTQGTTGVQGEMGAMGTQGNRGAQGIQGIQGTMGIQGTTGTDGDNGIDGTQGGVGSQGLQGFQGYRGTNGVQGTLGEEGIRGTRGIQGAAGLQGIQGAAGIQGIQGTIGTVGIQIQGSVGNVWEGMAGDNYWITITGFGTQGYTGSRGLQGLQGDIGIQGSVGIQGSEGTQGIQGSIGPSAFPLPANGWWDYALTNSGDNTVWDASGGWDSPDGIGPVAPTIYSNSLFSQDIDLINVSSYGFDIQAVAMPGENSDSPVIALPVIMDKHGRLFIILPFDKSSTPKEYREAGWKVYDTNVPE